MKRRESKEKINCKRKRRTETFREYLIDPSNIRSNVLIFFFSLKLANEFDVNFKTDVRLNTFCIRFTHVIREIRQNEKLRSLNETTI